jgi:hypothetical protein
MRIWRKVPEVFACTAISVVLVACSGPRAVPDAPGSRAGLAAQAACRSLVPASQGGPMPTGDVAVLRWLGTANYELAYHGKIVIMDTFYERPARTASLGFTVAQVRKADVILIGHAHADHISDVAPVAAQTGAPVIGSAISTEKAIALGVPKAQTITVVGNETLRYGDIAIRPTHIIHSQIEDGLISALGALYKLDAPPLTPAEKVQSDAVLARGSRDPRIITEGTMGFTFTFPSGFTIVWFDSVGDPNAETPTGAGARAGRCGHLSVDAASHRRDPARLYIPTLAAVSAQAVYPRSSRRHLGRLARQWSGAVEDPR